MLLGDSENRKVEMTVNILAYKHLTIFQIGPIWKTLLPS